MKRMLALLALCCIALPSWAFELDQLRAQLAAAPVVSGSFVQQKYLRSLPQPLTSTGQFTLVAGKGLLWKLRAPLHQDLYISPRGVFRRGESGAWQPLRQTAGAGHETRLFLSVLAGDTQALQQSFDLDLSGDASAWRLVLTPRSALLRQIFTDIRIEGGRLVARIELRETQGDRTVMQMQDTRTPAALTQEEQDALGP